MKLSEQTINELTEFFYENEHDTQQLILEKIDGKLKISESFIMALMEPFEQKVRRRIEEEVYAKIAKNITNSMLK